MNTLLLSLLSGFLGAIVGALIYGYVALRGVKKQIAAAAKLEDLASLDESIASLQALAVELIESKVHLSCEYEG